MKKLLIIIFSIFLRFNTVFAELNLILSSDKTNYAFDEVVKISLDLNTESWWNIPSAKILWLESFSVLSQSSQTSLVYINWESQFKNTINLTLRPNSIWEFVIWPASIESWSGSIDSNTITINVNHLNNVNSEENLDNDLLNTDFKSIDNNNSQDDIYWVKWWLEFANNYFIYLFYILLIVVFFFYYFLNKYFSFKEVKTKPKSDIIIWEDKLIFKELKILQRKANDINKNEFYGNLNILFRRYLNYLWVHDSHKLSLKEVFELATNIDKNFLNLFKKSYLIEFWWEEESDKTREILLKDFIKELTK